MKKIPIVVIAGPTGSGKSALALSLAQRHDGEIISADSMQIYRGLNIGTAKESRAEQTLVPHHLLDIVNMNDTFSVYDFIQLADRIIVDIHHRRRLPIVVGGTGFYVKALLGLQPLEYEQSDQRQNEILNQQSAKELRQTLSSMNNGELPVDPNNRQRLIRAIQKQQQGKRTDKTPRPQYQALVVGLEWPREVLYERINQRVNTMMKEGLLEEARQVYKNGGDHLQAGKGIGYKEFYPYFENQVNLATVVAKIQQNSRRYAKRQLTYWRHQIPGLVWVDAPDALQYLERELTKLV